MSRKLIGAATVVVLAFFAVLVSSPVANAAEVTFEHIATHPQAASQATNLGKSLKDIKVYDDKFYIGYGDWNDNTGPIHVNPFDPQTGLFTGSVLSVPTEAINVFREINGKLYAPMIDPEASWTSNVGYATDASGVWQNAFKAPAVHIFDMTSLDGFDLWMVGASVEPDGVTERGATAYRSTDNGQTWSVVRVDQSSPGNISGGERYHWIANLNGKIYIQANTIPASPVRNFDGTTWSTGTTSNVCAGASNKAEVFKGKLYCPSAGGIGLSAFDGTVVVKVEQSMIVADMYSDDEYLYVLGHNQIKRSADGQYWETIVSTPPEDLSFFSMQGSVAVYDGYLYYGGDDAKLYRSSIPIDEFFETPTVTDISRTTVPVNESKIRMSIKGENISNDTRVQIGGQDVTDLQWDDGYLTGEPALVFFAPLRSQAGNVDIVVSNPTDKSVTLEDAIAYSSSPVQPTISSVSESVITVGTKATEVTVYGTSFSEHATVKVSSSVVSSETLDDTSIRFTLPSSAVEKEVSLSVTNPGNRTATLAKAFRYIKADYQWGFADQNKPIGSQWESIDMSSDGRYIIAAARNGLPYTSSDGGQTWRPRLDIPNTDGNGLLVAVSSNGRHQVVTDKSENAYVYVSHDYGETWSEKKSSGLGYTWRSAAISDDGMKIALTLLFGGVRYSLDGGNTWQGSTGVQAEASVGQLSMSADGMKGFLHAYSSGTYRTIDAGATWEVVNVGGVGTPNAISISDDGGQVVVANSNGRVYISTDMGETWTYRQPNGITNGNSVTQSQDGSSIYIAAQDNLLYRSNDAGVSWQSTELSSGEGYSQVVTNGEGDTVLAGTSTSLLRSVDQGVTWEEASGEPILNDVSSISTSSNGRYVLATDQAGNVVLSDEYGADLSKIYYDFGQGCFSGSGMSDSGAVMAVSSCSGPIFISRDHGQTWTESDAVADWFSLSVSGDGEKIAAGSYEYVYVSHDGGDTWSTLTNDNSASAIWTASFTRDGEALVSTKIDVDTYMSQIYISDDGGSSLGQIVSFEGIDSLYSSPFMAGMSDDKKKIFIRDIYGIIYIAKDNGQTFQIVGQGYSLPSVSSDGKRLTTPNATSRDGGNTWLYHAALLRYGATAITMASDASRVYAIRSGMPLLIGQDIYDPSQPQQPVNPVKPITPAVTSPREVKRKDAINKVYSRGSVVDQIVAKTDSHKKHDRDKIVIDLDKEESFARGSGSSIILKKDREFSFTIVDDNGDRHEHRIIFGNVDRTDSSKVTVTFTIHSDPITLTMAAGERKEVDITGDGTNDLGIFIENISGESAYLRVWKTFAGVEKAANSVGKSTNNTPGLNWNSIAIVAILAIGVLVAVIVQRKRAQSKI